MDPVAEAKTRRIRRRSARGEVAGLHTFLNNTFSQFYDVLKNCQMVPAGFYSVCHGTQENAELAHALTDAEWGKDSTGVIESFKRQSYKRHHAVATKSMFLVQ